MHTDEDYEKSIEDENDYSDFYNTAEEIKNDKGNSNKKAIIIIIILAIVLIALIVVLLLVFKKKSPIDFNLGLENVASNAWSKENVTVNVNIPDDKDLKSVKYTINCNNKCEYVEVTDRKILISNKGTSVVSVIVTNIDDVENKKDITVKIDDAAPEIILSPNETNIKSNGPITVCAVCNDKESGCKQEKVCTEYTKTSKDQILTVEDNAGNTTVSNKFSVTIGSNNTATPTPVSAAPSCSLSVNKSGLVTATYKNANKYHGFSSSYSGSNSDKKQVSLDKDDATETVKYYVKNSDGKTATCSITVNANCKCLYRGANERCYRKLVKTIKDPNSKECANATVKTNVDCSFYDDEGLTCEYSKK